MRSNLHLGWPSTGPGAGVNAVARRRVRRAAAVLALANAVAYALIGAGVAVVVREGDTGAASLALFGALACSAFLLGAVLLSALDRRALWLLGGLFQLFAIATYFGVAPQRDPSYEPWGLSLKVAQLLLLALLTYLAWPPGRAGDGVERAA